MPIDTWPRVSVPGGTLPGKAFKPNQNIIQEEGEPDAFPPALISHPVHPIIPIATSHQWKPVSPKAEPALDGADPVLIQRDGFLGWIGLIEVGLLPGFQWAGFEQPDLFVEDRPVTDAFDVSAGDVGQPEEIVGKMGSDSPSGGRVPPMLNIPLPELVGGRP